METIEVGENDDVKFRGSAGLRSIYFHVELKVSYTRKMAVSFFAVFHVRHFTSSCVGLVIVLSLCDINLTHFRLYKFDVIGQMAFRLLSRMFFVPNQRFLCLPKIASSNGTSNPNGNL